MGGGGAAEVQETIEGDWPRLKELADLGVMAVTGEDDAFIRPRERDFARVGMLGEIRQMVEGDLVRDWRVTKPLATYFPYNDQGRAFASAAGAVLLWPHRTTIQALIYFGQTKAERGMLWQEYGILVKSKSDARLTITFAEVATHNHFVLDRGGKVFKQTAPVIKLPAGVGEDDYLGLLGLLNSSTARGYA